MHKYSEKIEYPDNPREKSHLAKKWSFWWLKDLFALGLKRPIEQEDIYKSLKSHGSKRLTDKCTELWEKELTKKSPSLLYVFWQVYAAKLLILSFFFIAIDAVSR